MADRLCVMNGGVIRQLGTPETLYDHPCDRFCAQFLGDINFIDGKISGDTIETSFGSFKLHGDVSGNCVAGIRPERIRFVGENTPGAFKAQIVSRTFLGESCDWQLQAGDQLLAVRECAPARRECGSSCYLRFEEDFLLAMAAGDGE